MYVLVVQDHQHKHRKHRKHHECFFPYVAHDDKMVEQVAIFQRCVRAARPMAQHDGR